MCEIYKSVIFEKIIPTIDAIFLSYLNPYTSTICSKAKVNSPSYVSQAMVPYLVILKKKKNPF